MDDRLDDAELVENFTLHFFFRKQNNSTFLLLFMFFMRLRSCIYAPAADCLNTKHVTTTGAPVRCPDSYAHRVFACAGSIRTMNVSLPFRHG